MNNSRRQREWNYISYTGAKLECGKRKTSNFPIRISNVPKKQLAATKKYFFAFIHIIIYHVALWLHSTNWYQSVQVWLYSILDVCSLLNSRARRQCERSNLLALKSERVLFVIVINKKGFIANRNGQIWKIYYIKNAHTRKHITINV